jgi:hypothetical protein
VTVAELDASRGRDECGPDVRDDDIGLFCWGETPADLTAALEQARFEAAWRGWRLVGVAQAFGGSASCADRGPWRGRALALRKVDYGRVIEFYNP